MSVPYADNIVFNLTLTNKEPNDNIPAEIYVSRDQAFVNNIENYYIRLLGASIATDDIPLFIYEDDMYVEIVNLGFPYRTQVVFPVIFTTIPKYVIFLQQFINGVNEALRTVHALSLSPGNPPFFIYENEEFKLIVDQLYTDQSIGLNTKLIAKLPFFIITHTDGTDMYYLTYGNFGNNSYTTYPGGINYPVYVIPSNVKGFNALQEFNNIIVACNSIPVNRQQLNNLTIATNTLGILDIIPIGLDDITKYTIKTYTQTTPTYNDLLSKGKISEIDFKIYVLSAENRIRPLSIIPGASITCRIEFVNKEIVKNFYPHDGISKAQLKY